MTPVPEPLARLAGIMSTFRPSWYLCGGWAVDSWRPFLKSNVQRIVDGLAAIA